MTTLVAHGLNAEQRRTFQDRGLVRLDGLIPRRAAKEMADSLWKELARRYGVQRRDATTWRIERPTDFKALAQSGAFKAMATPALRGLLDDLLGRGSWEEPARWGQPLPCFPRTTGRWDVPNQNWHLDLPADLKRFKEMKGRLFVVLEPVRPKGGGTLVVAGSHRLVQGLVDASGARLSSSEMRKHLKSAHRWFAELMSPTRNLDRIARFMAAPTEVRGVSVQVEEMTGEPGDVWLMDPAALHTLAPNMLDTPRLVLAQFVYPRGYFA